ncbi:MAG: tetratricopeptide repeat protein, partial [Xanthobacteraceae bacterium]
MTALRSGRIEDAHRILQQVLRKQPKHVAALNVLGIVLTQRGQFAEAESYLRRALQEYPNSDPTLYNYGVVLKALKRPAEALERFTQALAINQAAPETWNNRGTVWSDLQRYDEAIADFEKALTLNPLYAEASCNKGKSLTFLRRWNEASSAYERALALKPELAEAWIGRGNVFAGLAQYNDALAAYDRALILNPDDAEAWLLRGNMLMELRRYDEAFAACDKAAALGSEVDYLAGLRLQSKLYACDWRNLEAECAQLRSTIREGKPSCVPFVALGIPSSLAEQLQCARTYVQKQPHVAQIWRGEVYSHDRPRVAYVSADFREHATVYLTAGLFEQHDRSRFEMTAISLAPEQDSEVGRRLKASFERYVDCSSLADQQIAELIRKLEIDILVDLKGFTRDSRPGVVARRPAPIAVNWLGYPGTMGAPYIDYIIADRTVIPEENFEFYDEKVIWLPDSYQVNDSQRMIATHTPTRRELDLPDGGFVFCCFNH